MKTKKFIVGIDYSASSTNALKYAMMLAHHTNSELLLFHVFEAPVIYTNSGLYFMSYNSIKKDYKEKLEKFAKKEIGDAVPYALVSKSGFFKDEVNDLIKKNTVHSFVLGLESKTKINRYIYGSKTTDVAGKIDCPVIIVPESYKKYGVGKLVIAFDNAELPGKKCLLKIKDFINSTQSKVKVFHIKTPDEIIEQKNIDFVIDSKLTYKTQVKKSKSLVDGISAAVKQENAQAIISIARKHSFIYRFFNDSNTKDIAYVSKVPVVVMHE
jgi:nucleotide-binding universal stress UspA family protein